VRSATATGEPVSARAWQGRFEFPILLAASGSIEVVQAMVLNRSLILANRQPCGPWLVQSMFERDTGAMNKAFIETFATAHSQSE